MNPMRLLLFAAWLGASLPTAAQLCGPAMANGADVDWTALAKPERLQSLRASCWKLSVGQFQGTAEEFARSHRETYDCLVASAVAEFGRYFATDLFPADEFERRLRQVSDGRAQLVADLYEKTGRCSNCTDQSIRLRSLVRIWTVEFYLSEIWKSYSFGGPG